MLLLGKSYSLLFYPYLERNGKEQTCEKMKTPYMPAQREDGKEKAKSKLSIGLRVSSLLFLTEREPDEVM